MPNSQPEPSANGIVPLIDFNEVGHSLVRRAAKLARVPTTGSLQRAMLLRHTLASLRDAVTIARRLRDGATKDELDRLRRQRETEMIRLLQSRRKESQVRSAKVAEYRRTIEAEGDVQRARLKQIRAKKRVYDELRGKIVAEAKGIADRVDLAKANAAAKAEVRQYERSLDERSKERERAAEEVLRSLTGPHEVDRAAAAGEVRDTGPEVAEGEPQADCGGDTPLLDEGAQDSDLDGADSGGCGSGEAP